MKKIIALSIALLFVAGAAYALEIQNSGMMYVRGSYISVSPILGHSTDSAADLAAIEADLVELDQDPNDAVAYSYYDMELDMTTKLVVDDSTKIILNYEIHDENYIAGNTDDSPVVAGKDLDDNIEIKRAYFTHTFGTGTTLDAGLMDHGAWSYDWANNNNGGYRVKLVQKIPAGICGFLVDKLGEVGQQNDYIEDAEADDADQYALFAVLNLGDFALKPLYVYNNVSNRVLDQGGDGSQTHVLDISLDGPIGPVGFELEVTYAATTVDEDLEYLYNGEDSYATYGAYLNVWGDVGAAKVGGFLAYGNYDEDAGVGQGFGGDFTPTVVGADWINIGSVAGNTGTQYYAVTMGQLYASMAVSEALSLNGSITYWTSNEKDTDWEDANGWEFDLGCAYKISNNMTYSIAAGYADVNLDEDIVGADIDPDAAYRIYHKLQINF